MRQTLTLALVFAALVSTACGDDTVKPGSLNVLWTHPSTATCDSRHIARLEARAYKGTATEAAATGSSSCPAADRNGTIPLTNLVPGTYRIEVEGFDAADKGTYLGVIEKQKVSEGKATDTTVVTLSQKPVFLHVGWTLPGGALCAASGIAEVQVDVIYDAGTSADIVDTQRVKCDTAIKDPRDATKTIAGVVFPDLEPNDDVSLALTGYSSANKAVATASEENLEFSAGDNLDKSIALVACPGDPPVCP
ncbi:MAG: hypothetical protein U1F43_35995 [Myxococcota bacterium]